MAADRDLPIAQCTKTFEQERSVCVALRHNRGHSRSFHLLSTYTAAAVQRVIYKAIGLVEMMKKVLIWMVV